MLTFTLVTNIAKQVVLFKINVYNTVNLHATWIRKSIEKEDNITKQFFKHTDYIV